MYLNIRNIFRFFEGIFSRIKMKFFLGCVIKIYANAGMSCNRNRALCMKMKVLG